MEEGRLCISACYTLFMATTNASVWDRALEPFTRCLDAESARRLAEFRFDAAVETRVHELAERANWGLLSDEERREYEAFIELGNLISILQLKIKRQLHSNG